MTDNPYENYPEITVLGDDDLFLVAIDGSFATRKIKALNSATFSFLAEEHLLASRGDFKAPTTNPAELPVPRVLPTNETVIQYAAFNDSIDEIIVAYWTPPSNWNGGQVKFKLKYTHPGGTPAQLIDFDVFARAFADDDPLDAAFSGTPANIADNVLAQNDMTVTDFSSLYTVLGSPAGGKTVEIQLKYDSTTSTLVGDCQVMELIVQYTKLGITTLA